MSEKEKDEDKDEKPDKLHSQKMAIIQALNTAVEEELGRPPKINELMAFFVISEPALLAALDDQPKDKAQAIVSGARDILQKQHEQHGGKFVEGTDYRLDSLEVLDFLSRFKPEQLSMEKAKHTLKKHLNKTKV